MTKVIDIELSQLPPGGIDDLAGYAVVQILVRLHGIPIGYVRTPVINGHCSVQDIVTVILDKLGGDIIRHLLSDWLLAVSKPSIFTIDDFINIYHPVQKYSSLPSVSVAVCTHNRTEDLKVCLDSINNLDYPDLDILVVDNAPNNNDTKKLVDERYPGVRYIRELRPGLNWARNRAITEARGEIIAYTDDDVVVDPGWVKAFAAVFAEDTDVMAITGLVVPYELETEAQQLFEEYNGFGRGFRRKWYSENNKSVASVHGGTGKFGTGANMAYRRSLFDRIGYFDPALDVGTVTNGGGDLEMFFRVLKKGHTLVYEPNAIVRHRHRTDYRQLHTQITNWGIGFSSYIVKGALAHPDERLAFLKLWAWWFINKMRAVFFSFLRPTRSRELLQAELKGLFIGLMRYYKARSRAEKIAASFGPVIPNAIAEQSLPGKVAPKHKIKTAIRSIDITEPLLPLVDVSDCAKVHLVIKWKEHPLGTIEIATYGQPVGINRLHEIIVDHFGLKLLYPYHTSGRDFFHAEIYTALKQHYIVPSEKTKPANPVRLSAKIPVSVVVATYDRPEDLHNCLRCLSAIESGRQIEIIVVDNNPSSGLTPPVVNEFSKVILVNEPRKGLSFARNKGIVTSTGEIIITIDDDVTMPVNWLEKLIAPFTKTDIGVVTGNVLPKELETEAQHLFELYGGLGRGFEPFTADRKWFESTVRRALPTWKLGSTANAAFRVGIFHDSQIGLMDESLGAGTPAGCSEDTYLFYKALKAGYTIVYEPTAYVWHKHRMTMGAFRRQIYNYSKGHVAYHLKTLLNDHDLRALIRLLVELPQHHVWKITQRLLRRNNYPLSLTLLEVAGNFAGPFALLRSSLRVKRIGRSEPYIPVSKRSINVSSQHLVSNNLT
jgi:GT2 family glycosyltransferase